MTDMDHSEEEETEQFGSYSALLIAFKTMKERCQQLQTRLTFVEKENECLRSASGTTMCNPAVKVNDTSEQTMVQALQDEVLELTKQKQQLCNRIHMVAAENGKLWDRLTKLTKTNKSLDNQLTKISDTLKQHSPAKPSDIVSPTFLDVSSCNIQDIRDKCMTDTEKREQTFEEISLKLINSIMLEKSDLEQQYAEIVELQNGTELNLRNIGFTYPDDFDTDSLEQLKQHDTRLSQIKETLLTQQSKLKTILQCLKNRQGATCNSCLMKASKKLCQTGTQFDCDDSPKEDGGTQTSLPLSNLGLEKSRADPMDDRICPLCGKYEEDPSFTKFHEHVLTHFSCRTPINDFEIIDN